MAKAPETPSSSNFITRHLIGILDEFRPVIPAVEKLTGAALPVTAAETETTQTPRPDTTVIYKKDDAYHVFIKPQDVDAEGGLNTSSLSTWLMSLSNQDVVYFYCSGRGFYFPSLAQILITIRTQCAARKIFMLDHLIECPFFIFVCDEIRLGPLGAIVFTRMISNDPQQGEQIFVPLVEELYRCAVALHLLTAQQAHEVVTNDAILFKTADQIIAGLSSVV